MSIRSFDNWNRYLDNQNHPLHGCIQFNIKDGNTIAPIYDRDGTPLNNPIITDEYGRTQHQVFIEEDVVAYYYKYIGSGIWNTQLDIDTSDTTKWSLQYTSENQYSIDGNITTDSPYSVNTIQDLRTIDPSTVPNINGVKYIALLGYYEAGDKELINYIWDADSVLPDDGGAVIATNELTGRWIMITPTEHLDVRHYGVFPSNSQNMNDQTEQIQRAMTYANSKGLRLFFDTYSDTQTYRNYKLSNITLTPIQIIDVSKGVQFIDTNVTIRSSSKEAFNNDPYFVNGDTNLYSNFAKSSWNIKTLNKSQSNVEATYIIDDSTKSTNITILQGWNVSVNQNITGYTFVQCNISGDSLISSCTLTSCNLDVIGCLSTDNTLQNLVLTEKMFNGSPTPQTAVNGCIADIDDFGTKVNLWNYLHWRMGDFKDIDFKNVTIPSDFAIMNQELGDRTYSNFIGTGTSHTFGESSIQHVYRFNNVQGNIRIPGNANNTYVFDNCSVNLTFSITTPACTIIIRDSEVILNSNLPNATIMANSSTISLNASYNSVSIKDSTLSGIASSTRLNCANFTAYSSIVSEEVSSPNILYKDSQINKDIYSTEHQDNNQYVIDCYMDNDIFNAQHHLSSSNANTIVRGAWVNNTGNVDNPIVIDMTNLVNTDGLHQYEYENNNGTFLSKYYKQTYMQMGCYTIYGDVWSAYYLNRPELFTVPHLVYRGEAFPILDGSNRARYAYGVFIPQLWQPTCEFFSIGTATKRIKLTIQVPFSGNIYPLNGTSFSAINTMTYTYSDSVIANADGLNHKLTEFNGHMLAGPQYIPYSNDLPKDVPHDSSVIPPDFADQGYFIITVEIV